MLIHEIPKEKIRFNIEKLHTTLNPDSPIDMSLIKKALKLFRQGKVYNVEINEDILSGVVQDYETYSPEVQLDFLEISFCPCEKEEGICEHIVAVLFYAFSLFDSPGEFYNEWKAGNTKTPSLEKEVDNWKKKNKLVGGKTVITYEHDSIADWIDYFSRMFIDFKEKEDKNKRHSPYFFFTREVDIVKRIYEFFYNDIMNQQVPKDPTNAAFFRLHGALFTFKKILEIDATTNVSSNPFSSIIPYAQELVGDIESFGNSLNKYKLTSTYNKMLIESLPIFDSLLADHEDFTFERLTIYRNLWSIIGDQKTISDYENKMIEKIHEDASRLEYKIAYAHLAFLRKDDTEAINRISELEDINIYYYTMWIELLSRWREWDRLHIWIPFIKEKLSRLIRGDLNPDMKADLITFYLEHFEKYFMAKENKDDYINIMFQWLPYSFYPLNDFLIQEQEYKAWTELMIVNRIQLYEIDSSLLKKIESENREVLLPLYHQSAHECILEKNRDSYRQAVRYLRKLRTHYRALKRMEEWEVFISSIAHKYKRLRAFQEELRKGKGKLIND